jgi:hypothetical protein
VDAGIIRGELAKLVVNVYEKRIKEPHSVHFYVVPDVTNPVQDLLDDRPAWQRDLPAELRKYCGGEPSTELIDFGLSWWPEFDIERAVSLTDRSLRFPSLYDQFFALKKVIDAGIGIELLSEMRLLMSVVRAMVPTAATPVVPADIDVKAVLASFREQSSSLLSWPTTIGKDRWIERSEYDQLKSLVLSDDRRAIVLLGAPGCGKSALLARYGQSLVATGIPVLAIKADKLDPRVDSAAKLAETLLLPGLVPDCVRTVAGRGILVVLLDQLDALADLVDLKSERLNVILDLMHKLSSVPNVRVVCSCREFEYRHDSRLAAIDATAIQLALPSWEQVMAELGSEGIDAMRWPEALRELLRVPQQLKVFLERFKGTTEDLLFTTYQQMLDDLWQQKVLNRGNFEQRTALLLDLAEEMARRETLWVPSALFEGKSHVIDELEAEGILVRPDRGPRIGFQHQTVFEHVRARAFARGKKSLLEVVLAQQDGLFVRPTLWAALHYLREAAPDAYRIELEKLWSATLRLHIRYLLIEFVGQVTDPRDHEQMIVGETLANDQLYAKVLSAVKGNRGWFDRLSERHIPKCMQEPKERAWPLAYVIQDAWTFARDKCLDLIELYWLVDSSKDLLTWQTFSELTNWDDRAIRDVCIVAGRTEINDHFLLHLVTNISEHAPGLAPTVFRAAIERELARLEVTIDTELSVADPDMDDGANSASRSRFRHADQFRKILERRSGFYGLPNVAEAAPREFVESMWPCFVRVISHALADSHDVLLQYRDLLAVHADLDDPNYDHQFPVLAAMQSAIVGLSEANPSLYLDFVKQAGSVDAMPVQVLLCRGLCNIAVAEPDACLDFLLEDPRRLIVGNFEDRHKYSRELIAGVARHLSEQQLLRLEDGIHSWTMYRPERIKDDPSTEFNRRKWERENRLRLLKTLPFDRVSGRTRAIILAEEAALPDYRDQDHVSAGPSRIDSPMSPDQMAAASDDNILGLFEELVDNTDWHHPRDWLRGGSIEASRALAQLAKQSPERCMALIRRMQPGKQENPVAHVLRSLAGTAIDAHQIFALVRELDKQGFHSSGVRESSADVIAAKVSERTPLPDDLFELLMGWLPDLCVAPSEDEPAKPIERGEREVRTILWQSHSGIMVPTGTYPVLRAITRACLEAEPHDFNRWLAVLESHVERKDADDVWRVLSIDFDYLRDADGERAAKFIATLFRRHPGVRDSILGALLIGKMMDFLPEVIVRESLAAIRTSDWIHGPQVYGELLGLRLLGRISPDWAQHEYLEVINPIHATSEEIIWVKAGLAFAASRIWEHVWARDKATEVLTALMPNSHPTVATAIMEVFVANDSLPSDINTHWLLDGVKRNPHVLLAEGASYLVEHLTYLITEERELVYDICDQMVASRGNELVSPGSNFAASAPHLTNIAITLQRMGGAFRAKGLELFERLLVLSVYDAQAALNSLDHRPLNIHRGPVRRRTHRRKRS